MSAARIAASRRLIEDLSSITFPPARSGALGRKWPALWHIPIGTARAHGVAWLMAPAINALPSGVSWPRLHLGLRVDAGWRRDSGESGFVRTLRRRSVLPNL